MQIPSYGASLNLYAGEDDVALLGGMTYQMIADLLNDAKVISAGMGGGNARNVDCYVAHLAVGHVEGPQVRYPSAGLTGFVQRRPMHLKRSAAMVRKAYQRTVRCAQVTFEVTRT